MLQRELRLMFNAANVREEGVIEPPISSRDRFLKLQFSQSFRFSGVLHGTHKLRG